MSTYYLVHKHNQSLAPLGEISFNKFYVEDGFFIMMDMINNGDPSINNFVIRRSDSPKEITIEEFIEEMSKYQMMGI